MYKKIFLISLLLLVYSCADSNKSDSEEKSIFFAQITDTHLGLPKNDESLEKVIRELNTESIPLEFVAHTGDVMNRNIKDEEIVAKSKEILNTLTIPILYSPGNNDVLSFTEKTMNATADIFESEFNELIHTQEYKGLVAISVCTETLVKYMNIEDYELFTELENVLKENRGKPCIVFHHTPSVNSYYLNKKYQGWSKKFQAKWIDLLNKYKVKAVIAGHFHRDEMHWLGQVPLFVSAPVAKSPDGGSSYRIYEYKNGRVSYMTQHVF